MHTVVCCSLKRATWVLCGILFLSVAPEELWELASALFHVIATLHHPLCFLRAYLALSLRVEETTCVMTVFLYTNDAGAWVLECAYPWYEECLLYPTCSYNLWGMLWTKNSISSQSVFFWNLIDGWTVDPAFVSHVPFYIMCVLPVFC